ncbi:MAG: cellulose synthase/poly-beta-1,6-N-acetylglucosamine synthase-like glycosyltransferase [Flammeovirgaceae bacterium]|jgi:cellulose synthase/poly-beta-1,6-N-acetylglucosamine synthase-like glycosyltransferase
MQIWEIIVLGTYGLALTFILFYSIIQFNLVLLYRKARKHRAQDVIDTPALPSDEELPIVTIQLPLYNEMYVVERLIDKVAEIEYPSDKLEIQVLDDSTDETVEIVAKKVEEWQAKGVDIQHVRRDNRKGYKAGALQHGMSIAKGEFIAIFDADFMPIKEFLKKTIPHFSNQKNGVVQTCWGHINKDYSLLTQLQAFGLDAHFSVEQAGRNEGGHFLNFNGTAGIWRKSTIEDAGGWHSDTITEDLDLSYRAQLKGWRIHYLEDIVSPAELPAAMNALKSQQFRWTKGAAETLRKHFGNVLKAKLPFSTKLHAAFHLLNSTLFLCIMVCSILSVPVLYIKHISPELKIVFQISSLFVISLIALIIFYWNASRKHYADGLEATIAFIPKFFMFLSVSMGLSLHNAIAVIEGYIGKKTPFVRTPKFNITDTKGDFHKTKYFSTKINWLTVFEGLLAIYFAGAIYLGYYLEDFGLFPFHFMLTLGFGMVFFYSIKHARN